MGDETFLIRWGWWSKADARVEFPKHGEPRLYNVPEYTNLSNEWKWLFANPDGVQARLTYMTQFKSREEAELALIAGVLSGACPPGTAAVSVEDAVTEMIRAESG